MTVDRPLIIVRTYDGITPQASGHEFTQDAANLARDGYQPTSQQWQGKALTVTYQRPATPAATAPATVHYEQRGTGVGGGIGQGIGIGMGCLIFIIGFVVVLLVIGAMNR